MPDLFFVQCLPHPREIATDAVDQGVALLPTCDQSDSFGNPAALPLETGLQLRCIAIALPSTVGHATRPFRLIRLRGCSLCMLVIRRPHEFTGLIMRWRRNPDPSAIHSRWDGPGYGSRLQVV